MSKLDFPSAMHNQLHTSIGQLNSSSLIAKVPEQKFNTSLGVAVMLQIRIIRRAALPVTRPKRWDSQQM